MRSSDFLPPVSLGSFSHRLRPTSRRLLILCSIAHADADARTLELGNRRSVLAGFRHRGDGRISRVTGPSSSYAPWSNTPPNASPPRPVSETTLLPSGGLLPSAFGIVCHFVAASPRLTRSRTYASPMPLPTPAQGLLPTRRAQLWSGGFRTRWTTHPNFQKFSPPSFPLDRHRSVAPGPRH